MCSKKTVFYIRFMFALVIVATTMAVACPQPIPPSPIPPEPDLRSPALISFESSDVIGLYMGSEGMILYNPDQYQVSSNPQRRTFRLQSDNQRRYVNAVFASDFAHKDGTEVYCTLSYRTDPGTEEYLVIKLTVIKENGGLIWLWNDIQEIGVIINE